MYVLQRKTLSVQCGCENLWLAHYAIDFYAESSKHERVNDLVTGLRKMYNILMNAHSQELVKIFNDFIEIYIF